MRYIASWSGGKDSTATIILAHLHNEPLDTIIFAEVMFDKETSGELPEQMAFIHRCIPVFQEWGYEVKILRSEKTYMDCFHHVVEKPTKHPSNKGKKKGFVRVEHCDVQRDCKLKPIRDFWKSINEDVVQYIGIAKDEHKRLDRVVKAGNQVSLLEKYGYTEQMALDLCIEYGLLSPIYGMSPRGGCWFCPNMRINELRYMYLKHRELLDKLMEMEKEPNLIGDIWNNLKRERITDYVEKFEMQDRNSE